MDFAQLSRWTRFASKGGIGKCIALQDCVARKPDDLMFLKDDEITVLMQLPDEDGIYLGYCEGVVGRFAATYVQINGKLKTPVISKRSSSLSKSPRPRSLTPSRKRSQSQGSTVSRAPSRAEDPSTSASPSSTVLNPLTSDSRQSPIPTEPSNHDPLITSSTSHSSSSSSQDPTFPPTPSDSYVGPFAKDKADQSVVPDLDSTHVLENEQTPIPVVPHSKPALHSPSPSNPDSGPTNGPLDTTWVNSDPAPPPSPQVPPSRTEPATLQTGADITPRALSMLQGFLNGTADDDDSSDDGGDEDEDGDDTRESTSLEDTVDGFPAPPTQIPTSTSSPSLSEDGDGASFYDNYRYSRLSISSKMSKASSHALVSQPSLPTSPLANEFMPPSPSQETLPPTARLPTRNVPPPLALGSKSNHAAAPSLSTSVASPLLHTNFTSPSSSPPMSLNVTTSRSPLSPVFDFRGGGAATALRQKIESERGSPLSNANISTVSTTSSTSEKKRGGPLPLVVMNPAPPPPYTPTSPLTPSPLASPSYTPMPMPSPIIPRVSPQPTGEPGPSKPRTGPFLPHPNAPKPSVTSQGALYWRSMPPAPLPPSNGLIQTLRRASQMIRVGPNGHPQFCTIYGSTTQDLLASVGPVLIFFSTDPPNDVPANRMRMANTPSPPVPASPKSISPSQGGLRPPAERHASTSTSNVNVIPRTNFIPKVATARPRSRSFSGFDSPANPAAQQKEKSRDESSIPHVDSEPTRPRSNSMAARAAAHASRIHQARQHTPSPLALSQVTAAQGQGPNRGPGSLPPSASVPASPSSYARTSPISPTTVRHVLKPAKSEPGFRRASPSKSSALEAEMPASPTTTTTVEDPPATPSIQISVQEQQSGGSTRGKLSLDTEGSSQVQAASHPQAVPLTASSSGSSLQQQDDGNMREGETVQVMDTDFELVRPALSRPRVSEDSSANGKSSGSEGRPSFLRVDSPATSLASAPASDTRSPVSPSAPMLLPSSPSAAIHYTFPTAAVEAHRALELKWIAAMAATPSALARKNKKIRRLLLEGVPASVRYQVWAHLADSRAKRIEGIYGQLGERERVPAFADIQRDAQECFVGDSRLGQPDGPLVSLLQSYLTMVPDIQYSKGLSFITGQLLLQSPEEDAFWIFISLMDTHLRPYFSSNSVQFDIDASLFAKAVESVDSTSAKKLFVEMGIPPIRVCRPWFSSLFVEALPAEYFLRVWDIFLSEGVVFLFRIGLALVTCCRRAIRDMRSESDALSLLARPPPFLLSSTPSALIELSSTFRIKDDDIRKQRVKLEAQVKRQTQSRLSNAVRRSSHSSRGNLSGVITLPTRS
ncbi:rab-GTPase-TBC domain-containing protein [Lactarius quietus]|nr:rab-GTPase-TBC domain-containing protein [Lactarius quietus]